MDRLEIRRTEVIKEQYPVGTRVRLVRMNDEAAPSKGTMGTVVNVDDIGTVHIDWDNGSALGIVIGEDSIIKDGETVRKDGISPFGE